MKTIKLFMFLCLFPCLAYAQTSIEGNWKIEWNEEDGTAHSLKLTLTSDGTYSIDMEMDDKVNVMGKYEFSENKLTIHDTGGEFACDSTQKGVYEISMTEETMTMTRISDECENRGSETGVMTFERIDS